MTTAVYTVNIIREKDRRVLVSALSGLVTATCILTLWMARLQWEVVVHCWGGRFGVALRCGGAFWNGGKYKWKPLAQRPLSIVRTLDEVASLYTAHQVAWEPYT